MHTNLNVKRDKPLNCLILAAGFGSRMGLVGEDLPKVLWPVFEKSLLELQVSYAQKLGCSKIFINTHYQHEKIEQFVDEKKLAVEVVFEPEILLVGGAIYNVAFNFLDGEDCNLLILNGDQFLYIDNNKMEQDLKRAGNFKALLYNIKVQDSSGYNEVIVKDDMLVGISETKESEGRTYLTYSGVSIVNVGHLKNVKGPSNYFDTIATFQNDKIYCVNFNDEKYWDFGTLERYKKSMFALLAQVHEGYYEEKTSKFIKFCLENRVFNMSKIRSARSYGEDKDCISLIDFDLGSFKLSSSEINFAGIKEKI